MSAPSSSADNSCVKDPTNQESEASTMLKCDINSVVSQNTMSKAETVLQPITNGALSESNQQKNSSGEPLQTSPALNGQDEKPRAETPHREIPGLLPLQSMTVISSSNTGSSAASTQSTSPRQPPPPLLPMKPVTTSTPNAPVLATKSAPPPLPVTSASPVKAKGKSTPANVSPQKEIASSSIRNKQVAQHMDLPEQEEKPKKRKIGLKKRHSLGSSGLSLFISTCYYV
jgi:hypothetical protein